MPRTIKRLTQFEIENAKPKAKLYKLNDGEGLRLVVRPSGKKVWQYDYRLQGRNNTYTIGEYGPKTRQDCVGTVDARRILGDLRALVKQGIDPNENLKEQRLKSQIAAENTFETVARDWHSRGTWVEKHAKNILSSLEKDVFKHIGHKPITKITSQDLAFVLEQVEKRDAPSVARRLSQRCEDIFDYAIGKGLCLNNPANGRAKFLKQVNTEHRPHLTEAQMPEFLYKLDQYHGRDYIRLCFKLMVLSFLRPGEVRHARWEEIDLKDNLWRIPKERMKMKRDHIVPITRQIREILEELKPITGHSDYLFPSTIRPNKPISDVTLLKVLKILGYEGESKVTPSGFRHTTSTILNEHQFHPDVIERQMAHHHKNKIRATYNHAEYIEERVEMMQWYADHLDRLKARHAVNDTAMAA